MRKRFLLSFLCCLSFATIVGQGFYLSNIANNSRSIVKCGQRFYNLQYTSSSLNVVEIDSIGNSQIIHTMTPSAGTVAHGYVNEIDDTTLLVSYQNTGLDSIFLFKMNTQGQILNQKSFSSWVVGTVEYTVEVKYGAIYLTNGDISSQLFKMDLDLNILWQNSNYGFNAIIIPQPLGNVITMNFPISPGYFIWEYDLAGNITAIDTIPEVADMPKPDTYLDLGGGNTIFSFPNGFLTPQGLMKINSTPNSGQYITSQPSIIHQMKVINSNRYVILYETGVWYSGDDQKYIAIVDSNFTMIRFRSLNNQFYVNDLGYDDGTIMISGDNRNAMGTNSLIVMDTMLYIGGNLQGEVVMDVNNSCTHNAGDYYLNSRVVKAVNNITSEEYYTIPYNNAYAFTLPSGNYYVDMSPSLDYPNLCGPFTNQVVDTTVHYANLFSSQLLNNIGVEISMSSPFILPFQEGQTKIKLSNLGTLTANNIILNVVNDTSISAITYSISPSSIVGNVAEWNFPFLDTSSSIEIIVDYFIPATVDPSTLLNFMVSAIQMGTDNNALNNYDTLQTNILNSYDPNDKSVNPVGQGSQGFISPNQKLEYQIRFQNTGTFAAANIFILDTISSNLDLGTLKIIDASHSYNAEIINNQILRINFPNIMLIDSNASEPNSHGYFKFEIYPNDGLAENSQIKNKGYIFFDFNAPVITNTVLNTVTSTIGIEENDNASEMRIFPNPTNGLVYFDDNYMGDIYVYGQLGNLVKVYTNVQENIDISGLPSGIYYLNTKNTRSKVVLIK